MNSKERITAIKKIGSDINEYLKYVNEHGYEDPYTNGIIHSIARQIDRINAEVNNQVYLSDEHNSLINKICENYQAEPFEILDAAISYSIESLEWRTNCPSKDVYKEYKGYYIEPCGHLYTVTIDGKYSNFESLEDAMEYIDSVTKEKSEDGGIGI